jgi:hypothetical protein
MIAKQGERDRNYGPEKATFRVDRQYKPKTYVRFQMKDGSGYKLAYN